MGEVSGDPDHPGIDPQRQGEVIVRADLDLHAEPARERLRQHRPVDAGIMARHHVEARLRLDGLALVGLDLDLPAPVHRGIQRRQDLRRDQGGIVDQQGAALGHRGDQRTVLEDVGSRVVLCVLADQVADRGVAVTGDGEQVRERRLDQTRLAGARRAVEQHRHVGVAQAVQRLDVGQIGQLPGVVELAPRAADRAGLPGRGCCGSGGTGRGRLGAGSVGAWRADHSGLRGCGGFRVRPELRLSASALVGLAASHQGEGGVADGAVGVAQLPGHIPDGERVRRPIGQQSGHLGP